MIFLDLVLESPFICFVIGDILGVPVESKTREELKKNPVKDFLEYGIHNQPKGTWSDDTSMTIATMQSIINKNGIDYKDMMSQFVEWYKNGKYTTNGKCFDIGNTTRQALEKYYLIKCDPVECGGKENFDCGNGSLMRMLPIVFYCLTKRIYDNKEIYNLVEKVSSLTHANEKCIFSCYLYTIFMIETLKERIVTENQAPTNKKIIYRNFKETISKNNSSYNAEFNRILKDDIAQLTEKDIKSTGYVIDTLEASIWCFLTTDNWEQAILKAVNLGGDTDTIGAITGSIAGAYYQDCIMCNNEWFSQIDNWQEIFNIYEKFASYLHDN